MLFRLSLNLFATLIFFASAPANAWIVAAAGDSGYAHVSYDASSSEDASREALVKCGEKTSGCKLFGKPVRGPVALAIVRGGDAQVVATNLNPTLAVSAALNDCKVNYKNCRLAYIAWDHGAHWDAVAMGDGGPYTTYNADSLERAESGAIDGCRKRTGKPDSCHVKWASHSPEWIALAESKTRAGYAIANSRDAAVGLAVKNCQTENKETCDDISAFENAGSTAEPAVLSEIVADIDRAKTGSGGDAVQSKPRAGRLLRYSESCENADCVRRYENGRTVRYTACLNPATSLPMNDPSQLGGCGGTDSRGNVFGLGSL